jgi:hypothetical protein
LARFSSGGTTMSDFNPLEITRDVIEKRAYEIYLQRGGQDGGDVDDWLVAERELLAEQERPHADGNHGHLQVQHSAIAAGDGAAA